MTPDTTSGKLLLMSGLTFGSGRRLADYPELILAIEAEARAALEVENVALRAVVAAARPIADVTALAYDEKAVVVVRLLDALSAALAALDADGG